MLCKARQGSNIAFNKNYFKQQSDDFSSTQITGGEKKENKIQM